jgi:DNA-binding ferritin-like protein
MLTREFAAAFAAEVAVAADGIAMRVTDPAVQLDTLRWKLNASKASQRAATQMSPMMALLDTWVLSEQMRQFFDSGAGAQLFGSEHSAVRKVADELAADAQRLARSVTSEAELARYQAFVERFAREHPLTDLSFARASVVGQWVAETHQQTSLVQSVGTVAQSMNDVSERMRMLGESAPSQAVWEARLAIGESDFARADFGRTLAQAGTSLDRLTLLAESSPEQLRARIADLRVSMLAVSDRFDTSWEQMLRTVQEQREALVENVRVEREASVLAFDAQRAAFANDASRIADQAIASSGTQVRALVRELMLYGILLFIVVLGVPFAMGYYIGRLRTPRVVSAP